MSLESRLKSRSSLGSSDVIYSSGFIVVVLIRECKVSYLLRLYKSFMFVLGLYGVLNWLSMRVYGHRLPTIQKARFVWRHSLTELRAGKHTLEMVNQS